MTTDMSPRRYETSFAPMTLHKRPNGRCKNESFLEPAIVTLILVCSVPKSGPLLMARLRETKESLGESSLYAAGCKRSVSAMSK